VPRILLARRVGDRALVDTAVLLRRIFRESDVLGRLGGDEFVVLATDAAPVITEGIAARLRVALDAYNASRTHARTRWPTSAAPERLARKPRQRGVE
jgi:diguanylate cyclase (GGDEF)-like protein